MEGGKVVMNEKIDYMDEGLTILMKRYGYSVFWMCYAYLKDYQLAEDVAQETFIRVYQHYGKFHNQSSVKNWIIRIAINLCKSQKMTHWWKKQLCEDIMEVEEEIEERFEAVLNQQIIFEEISKLSPKYREAILLYYYQDFKISEIAVIMGEKDSTIKSRLKRAREKLKPRLKMVLGAE